MLMSGTTSLSDCTETLGRQPVSCIVWWTHGCWFNGKPPQWMDNTSH